MALAMPVVWSDRHRLHDPGGEVWVGVRIPGTERPARADAIRAVLAREGATSSTPARSPRTPCSASTTRRWPITSRTPPRPPPPERARRRPGRPSSTSTPITATGRRRSSNWADTAPRLSPDGSTVAYADGDHVWLAPTAGGPPRKLVQGGTPTWIDDARLVVSVERDDSTRLPMVDVADPWPRCLAVEHGELDARGDEGEPTVSPDATEVAYTLPLGDPADRASFVGPVVNAASVARFEAAVDAARREGTVVAGGVRPSRPGWFVEPTVVCDLPHGHPLERDELFLPFVTVTRGGSLDEALAEANAPAYGLTAGIFSEDRSEVDRFLDEIQAGVVYVNRRAGATTGAWPGTQTFCGWKSSGSTGNGGLGPYYLTQFMREQSRTVVGGTTQ